MNSNLNNKVQWQSRIANLIAGTKKHFPSGSLTIAGKAYDPGALAQTFQSLSDALTAADTAKAQWTDAVKTAQDALQGTGTLVRAYQSYLTATFGNTPATLADFGLSPRKARASLSTTAQATAVAKRTATRAARHTMGKVQKLDVSGNVTGVIVTPVIAPASAPTSAAITAPSGGGSPATSSTAPATVAASNGVATTTPSHS